ncbi:MAG: OmpA family protein [Desulfobacterales bacterium]|nr:OmpA family protein [Desulfobacterales bacterium]
MRLFIIISIFTAVLFNIENVKSYENIDKISNPDALSVDYDLKNNSFIIKNKLEIKIPGYEVDKTKDIPIHKNSIKDNLVKSNYVEEKANNSFEYIENNRLESFSLYFDLNSYTLKENEQRKLDYFSKSYNGKAFITGYTCKLGDKSINSKIAKKRAESVQNYLKSKGLKLLEIKAKPMCCYVSDKDEQNRRVEIKYKINQ